MDKGRAFLTLLMLGLIVGAARGEEKGCGETRQKPATTGEAKKDPSVDTSIRNCIQGLMETAGVAFASTSSAGSDPSGQPKNRPANALSPVEARASRAVAIFIVQRKLRKLRDEVLVGQFVKETEDAKPPEAPEKSGGGRDYQKPAKSFTAADLAEVEAAATAIEAAAVAAGVDEPFHAELVSGLITSRADTNPTEEQGQTLGAYVRWSSRSFTVRSTDMENDHSSVRIAGRFGRAPVTALIAEPGADIKATEIPAFVWDARAEWRRHGDRTDWLMYGGAGQNWLVSESVAAKGSAGQQVLMLSGGKVAWNFEGGFAVNAFREGRFERLAGLDAEPRFSLSVGYRKDTLLADAKKFGKNEDRLVIRMVLAQLRIFDNRKDAEKRGPFTLRFGVEHERGLTSRGAPSATRLLIAGDLDIVEALK